MTTLSPALHHRPPRPSGRSALQTDRPPYTAHDSGRRGPPRHCCSLTGTRPAPRTYLVSPWSRCARTSRTPAAGPFPPGTCDKASSEGSSHGITAPSCAPQHHNFTARSHSTRHLSIITSRHGHIGLSYEHRNLTHRPDEMSKYRLRSATSGQYIVQHKH